jgi:hypothetical protein
MELKQHATQLLAKAIRGDGVKVREFLTDILELPEVRDEPRDFY